MQSDDLITSSEAARILRRSQGEVSRLAKSGRLKTESKLPGLRGARLFDRATVNDLAKSIDSKNEDLRSATTPAVTS